MLTLTEDSLSALTSYFELNKNRPPRRPDKQSEMSDDELEIYNSLRRISKYINTTTEPKMRWNSN
ncbi:MAG: hypothetical protein ABIG28_02165 [archaeon]